MATDRTTINIPAQEPVTDPGRTHRLSIKTPGGPTITAAMDETSAIFLSNTIRQHCVSQQPVITLPLPEGDWYFNTAHVTGWRIVRNTYPDLT